MKIKILNDLATVPTKGTVDSAGYDLYAAITDIETIPPHTVKIIPTGLAIEVPKGYYGGIYARSGIATKQILYPVNCVGVIDSDYRGEVKVALYNGSDMPQKVYPKSRIAQLIISPYKEEILEISSELSETDRGFGGFGSTGM